MDRRIRQYGFAAIFLAVGIYFIVKQDFLEGSLYCLAGLAFLLNTLVNEAALQPYKSILTVITWALIIITALVFLWVIQFKYL
jgi:drug/metabolite transporter (DMT)-like permease